MTPVRSRIVACWLLLFPATLFAAEAPFRIRVVDAETGRGVPLVELKTTGSIRYYTDSAGIVAFDEPGLMNQSVFFTVHSHGYEFAKDSFGFAGKALDVKPGGSATLKIKRINIAQRLYRMTGGGIYRDSVLVGEKAPIREPLLNAQVLGQDSVVNAVYKGRISWFWGDTNRPSYVLGNFHVPGADSELPSQGGLDPEVGVDLTYFVDEKGFARPTAEMPGSGPTWIGGLVVLKEGNRERMFASYVKVKPPLDIYERGLCEWDDATNQFKKSVVFDMQAPLHPDGHPFLHREGDVEYIYFPKPVPLTRVRATSDDLKDLTKYEAYTCLKEGTRLEDEQFDRDAAGKLRYSWKRNTPVLDQKEQNRLVKAGRLKQEECLIQFRNAADGKPVAAHGGSVYWNEYRRKWIMLFVEIGGTSLLGEMWFTEADSPVGPWRDCVKIATHEKYSFYNPKQHPFFDKDGGRTIFFEGTYTHSFSGNNDQTPRYDYNQVLYKLDLADPRLKLPEAAP
jgi:hypothetical protein